MGPTSHAIKQTRAARGSDLGEHEEVLGVAILLVNLNDERKTAARGELHTMFAVVRLQNQRLGRRHAVCTRRGGLWSARIFGKNKKYAKHCSRECNKDRQATKSHEPSGQPRFGRECSTRESYSIDRCLQSILSIRACSVARAGRDRGDKQRHLPCKNGESSLVACNAEITW